MDWTNAIDFLRNRGYVSNHKLKRCTWQGNYIASLVKRGKLIEGIHWKWSDCYYSHDLETGGRFSRQHEIYNLQALRELFENGFKDDPEFWVEFNYVVLDSDGNPCQGEVSPKLNKALLDIGCEIFGYKREIDRKYYTAPDLTIVEQALVLAQQHGAIAEICED